MPCPNDQCIHGKIKIFQGRDMTTIACPNCGGAIIGDGYTEVLHCEFADEEDYESTEPDAGPVYCPLNQGEIK